MAKHYKRRKPWRKTTKQRSKTPNSRWQPAQPTFSMLSNGVVFTLREFSFWLQNEMDLARSREEIARVRANSLGLAALKTVKPVLEIAQDSWSHPKAPTGGCRIYIKPQSGTWIKLTESTFRCLGEDEGTVYEVRDGNFSVGVLGKAVAQQTKGWFASIFSPEYIDRAYFASCSQTERSKIDTNSPECIDPPISKQLDLF